MKSVIIGCVILRAVLREWACGAVGSALPWHGRGQGFESLQVHQLNVSIPQVPQWPVDFYSMIQITQTGLLETAPTVERLKHDFEETGVAILPQFLATQIF